MTAHAYSQYSARSPQRAAIPFRHINRADTPGFRANMQRHHLLPVALVGRGAINRFLDRIGLEQVGFHDFRRNGLLLPAEERLASQMALPLHRGPHPAYTDLVAERLGRFEADLSRTGKGGDARMRVRLLQNALRKRLLAARKKPMILNRRDPLGAGVDFSSLDDMAETLFAAPIDPGA
jgi:hypothetical protein